MTARVGVSGVLLSGECTCRHVIYMITQEGVWASIVNVHYVDGRDYL